MDQIILIRPTAASQRWELLLGDAPCTQRGPSRLRPGANVIRRPIESVARKIFDKISGISFYKLMLMAWLFLSRVPQQLASKRRFSPLSILLEEKLPILVSAKTQACIFRYGHGKAQLPNVAVDGHPLDFT